MSFMDLITNIMRNNAAQEQQQRELDVMKPYREAQIASLNMDRQYKQSQIDKSKQDLANEQALRDAINQAAGLQRTPATDTFTPQPELPSYLSGVPTSAQQPFSPAVKPLSQKHLQDLIQQEIGGTAPQSATPFEMPSNISPMIQAYAQGQRPSGSTVMKQPTIKEAFNSQGVQNALMQVDPKAYLNYMQKTEAIDPLTMLLYRDYLGGNREELKNTRQDARLDKTQAFQSAENDKKIAAQELRQAKQLANMWGMLDKRLEYSEMAKNNKRMTPSAIKDLTENDKNLNGVDFAIKLLKGEDVSGAIGDESATGIKGYLPQAVLNRIDPKGVDTRAAIANIGSLEIKNRSGAAVTAAEMPRLAPFIPSATDDRETALKKLNQFRRNFANEVNNVRNYYVESGYNLDESRTPNKQPASPKASTGGKPKSWEDYKRMKGQ